MGIVTGRASGNVFVIDLDDQKGPDAQAWWLGVISVENNGIDPETVEQRTGRGGRNENYSGAYLATTVLKPIGHQSALM